MNFRSPAWQRFRANRRGWFSLWGLAALYAASLCAPLYCHDPHRAFPSSTLDPHLRPAVSQPVHYPVVAAEYATAADGVVLRRAWGDSDRFADALGAPPPPEVAAALSARLRGESAPALEVESAGVSWRLTPSRPRPAPQTARVYLRPAAWRSMPPEPIAPAGGAAGEADARTSPLEPAVFPFRPVPGHPFGFDAAGRDVFSRVVYGGRTAMSFGLLLVAASLALGIFFGALQGWFVGWVDVAGQRFTEIWSAIPFLYVMIFLGNAFGRSFGLLLAVYAVFNWIGVAAYVRAEFLRLRTRPFVDAGRVQGLSAARLMFRHVLPNAVTPLVTLFPFLLVGAVGSLAALDYLGFGLPDGAPSWGELLRQAQAFRHAWWLVLWPSLAIFATMLLAVFVGEALRDAFDPKPPSSWDAATTKPTRAEDASAPPPSAQSRPMPALRVENLSVSFDTAAGELKAVDGVSLEIAPGEALGLVGESGCGKSVTAMSVLRLVRCPPGRMVSGRILVDGVDVAALPLPELRKLRGSSVGMVFQDPMTALSPLHRVGDQMLEALRLHRDVSTREGLDIAREWLEKCGLPDPDRCLREYPFRLSGGMQQRVMIASVLMTNPKLVVADEPTTALDATNQAQVLELMKNARGPDTALLLVSHDMGVVRGVCSRIAVMYAGRVVECGPAEEVFSRPRHPYTAALLDAMPSRHAPGERLPAIPGSVPSPLDLPPGCAFAPRCRRASAECSEKAPPPLSHGVHVCRCIHPVEAEAADGGGSARGNALGNSDGNASATPIKARDGRPAGEGGAPLVARGLSKRFGRFEVVSGMSLELRSAETLALVGDSGCGKTTLLRMLAGLEEPTAGEILLHGRRLGRRRSVAQRRAIQVVFQDPYSSLNPRHDIESLITEAPIAHGMLRRRDRAEFARDWLARVGLPPEAAERYPHEFSGGQLQRISIARALALKPEVLLLDEPVSALDVSVQAQILNLIADVKRDYGPAMLFVTHDMDVVRSVADRVVRMAMPENRRN